MKVVGLILGVVAAFYLGLAFNGATNCKCMDQDKSEFGETMYSKVCKGKPAEFIYKHLM